MAMLCLIMGNLQSFQLSIEPWVSHDAAIQHDETKRHVLDNAHVQIASTVIFHLAMLIWIMLFVRCLLSYIDAQKKT
jgi:hypothetical protein